MIAYLARRTALAGFTILAISVLSFYIIELPEGDTADAYFQVLAKIGDEVAEERVEVMRKYLGLDEPKHVRYAKWMWNLMHGDLGRTFYAVEGPGSNAAVQSPVKELLGDRLLLTVVLTGFTILITWAFAIPVGIYSAVRQHSVGDYVFTFMGFTGMAVPDFLLGLVLMYVAFAYFDQSVGGLFSVEYQDAPWSLAKGYDLLSHLCIPAIVLGTSGTAGLIRVMRNNLLDELAKPYVVTARAKGVPAWRLILKYPVRVAINPLISTVGHLLPALIDGSVIVSVVLGLPTMAPLLLTTIITQDSYTAGFIVLMLGLLTVLRTLVSDILLGVVDPRIRLTTS